jgi:hypothetical protein
MIELFKDGDTMAIRTDCQTESVFITEFSELLANVIDEGAYSGDWEFQLGIWLPQFLEICCKYRGYKADVEEQRVIVAGDRLLGAPMVHRIDPRQKPLNTADKLYTLISGGEYSGRMPYFIVHRICEHVVGVYPNGSLKYQARIANIICEKAHVRYYTGSHPSDVFQEDVSEWLKEVGADIEAGSAFSAT